ncbi:hypothetical protein [Aureimonas populi]|uniref:DUF340 domain-containing protein n=1 Tax=Aureimonas populi TaxID=1701758 RepID=A0ABW5CLB5_9HYPH|nr:hypothetical protein [Aureimonas populi]
MNRPSAHVQLSEIVKDEDDTSIGLVEKTAMLLVACLIGLAANWAATGTAPLAALPGMAILFAASLAGLLLAAIVPLRLPAVAWVSLIAILITIPGMPGAAFITEAVGQLNFLALATPALAYGGLALTQKEFSIARHSGWKIVIVAICVMFGTYIGSVIIADLTLRITG